MIRNGAQVVWESLVREGIDVIFGIPGGAVIPLYQFLCDYPICLIFMRHEQAAIHAADGYARVSGRVGVCLVTSGPGATNLVMGSATVRGFIPGCGTYRAGAPRNTLRAACCYGVGCDVHLLVSLRRLDSSHSALVSPQRRKRAARNRHVLAFTCALPQAGEGYQPW